MHILKRGCSKSHLNGCWNTPFCDSVHGELPKTVDLVRRYGYAEVALGSLF